MAGGVEAEWIVFVYMSTMKIEREQQWGILMEDKRNWGENWVILGDWNDLSCREEKNGGLVRSERSFQGFNNIIGQMGMFMLRMEGYKFTWGNNRKDEGFVEEVLDKAFASLSWLNNHPHASVKCVLRSASDHALLVLEYGKKSGVSEKKIYIQ
ncbi:RNA-directed DNA polymerase [Striga asiatica]|uniref:RNA-directed DNA polymerase n=1 Tax=Striga asiatica TaxID=4170 RepID=A0A5A7QQM2_STRAF|nr:RNA-directed DNA polymerase [Striga asiatica]